MLSTKAKIEIAEECGLEFNGLIEGEPQFIGTDKEFNDYQEELVLSEEGCEQGQQAEDESLEDARSF